MCRFCDIFQKTSDKQSVNDHFFFIVSWLLKNSRFLNELIYKKKDCYFMRYISIRNQEVMKRMMRLSSHSSFNYILSLRFLIWERCLMSCWMIERKVRSLKIYNQRSDHNMWRWDNILFSNLSLFVLLRSMYQKILVDVDCQSSLRKKSSSSILTRMFLFNQDDVTATIALIRICIIVTCKAIVLWFLFLELVSW